MQRLTKHVSLRTGRVLYSEYFDLMHLYWPLSRSFGLCHKDGRRYCSVGCSLDSCVNSSTSCNNCSYCIDYQISNF